MLTPEVLAYYERGGETDRLGEGSGRLEFLRTWDILGRVLPAPPGRIIDVGGATGVYAGPLAAAGYSVTVVDPVPAHVAAAAALPGVSAVVGDARALPVAGDADAVLMLGPLYHLTSAEDRLAAWREAARVVRPGGVVAGATISRFASALDGFAAGSFADPAFRAMAVDDLADGVHRNAAQHPNWFTTAYFHRPEEPAAEARAAGLREVRTVLVEGPFGLAVDRVREWLADPDLTAILLDTLRRIEHEPSLLGATAHLMTVGER
ncbi:class I SAM-dependent methyltransferase [Actinoplanes sp. NPDC051633]|uniref:class I SAM-dependent methyltransferase n=1 Tax=Actinoplanes sp. NPDC051633 TaxID=3155670 RepID=UPI003446D19C